MSVVNSWREGKVGLLYTDTAHVSVDTGKVAAFGSKAFTCANFPAVIGVTFVGGVLPWIIEPFADAPPKNVASLRKMMPEASRLFLDRARANGAQGASIRAIAVVWCSRSRRIRIFHCSSIHELGAKLQTQEVDYFLGSGCEAVSPLRKVIGSLRRGVPIGGDCAAIRIMDAQRRASFVSPDPRLTGVSCIGGSIERARVTREGVQFDTIHKWPDRVGERIETGLAA